MSQVKDYHCRSCGSALEFANQTTTTYCEYCGLQNVLGEIDDFDKKIETEFDQRFGTIMNQLKATGDPETRAYLFSRDLYPKLDVQMKELEEKYEEKFRYPLFHVPSFALLVKSLNITNALIKPVWDPNDMQNIVKFYSRELKLPIFKMMAQSKQLEILLNRLDLRSQHLANIYFIRGYSLTFSVENLNIMKNFLLKSMKTIDALIELPLIDQNDKLEFSRKTMYMYWKERFVIYNDFVETLIQAIKSNNTDSFTNFLEIFKKTAAIITKLKTESIPLFLSIPFIDGFEGDLSIFNYFNKIVDLHKFFAGKFTFIATYNIVSNYLGKIIKISDNLVNFSTWDSKWIMKTADSIDTIFNLLDNLELSFKVRNGVQETIYFMKGFQFSNSFVVSEKNTCKIFKDEYLVQSKINIYLPLAFASTYSILTKGFLWMKAGEDFDGTLLVNTLFTLDNTVLSGLYVNAVSLLDFSLKDQDREKIQLNKFIDIYEKTVTSTEVSDAIVLPMTATKSMIEAFISKTYDLFDLAQTNNNEPIRDFNRSYKESKFEKNLERLTGEITDIIYVPLSLVYLAKGNMKEEKFIPRENFQWKVISPFPLYESPNQIPEDFLGLKFEPNGLANFYDFIRSLQS